MPVNVRSASLALLALIASLVALHWAKDLVVPILLGIMVSYALTPIVNQMQRWRIPRPAGASIGGDSAGCRLGCTVVERSGR